MSKSRRLTLGNVRAIVRLVGECRDLGYDPGMWGQHLNDGLCRLTGTHVAVGGELRAPGQGAEGELAALIDVGLGPAERAAIDDFVRSRGFGGHPVSAVLDGWTGQVAARTRRQVVADRDWYGSLCFEVFHRPMGRDHCLVSPYRLPDGALHLITLHRTAGERDFFPRERRLLLLAHTEIGRLIGSVLVSARDPLSPTRLPPRVREMLQCLLEGDGEKQAAARMGLRRETVHQYVKFLYRRFGVGSRAELLARFIRRSPSTGTTETPEE